MTCSEICTAAGEITGRYLTRDPFALCREMGVLVLPQSLGRDENSIKGFFLQSHGVRTITVNIDLPEEVQRVIAAHELGHAVLHAGSGLCTFHEVSLYDSASMLEKDANLFAAEILLSDEDVLSVLNQDTTFYSAAAELMVPFELLDFKFRTMKWKGYKLVQPPVSARSTFLKNIPVPESYID